LAFRGKGSDQGEERLGNGVGESLNECNGTQWVETKERQSDWYSKCKKIKMGTPVHSAEYYCRHSSNFGKMVGLKTDYYGLWYK
jgi:hypothetical protein